MITFTDEQGPLGTVEMTSGGLRGSTRPLQRIADQAMAREHGNVSAAYARLLRSGNAYVQVAEDISLSSQLAVELASGEAWLHELRDADGKWTRTPADKPGTGLDRYKVPPHERLINPRADHPDPADYPFFKKHPVSADNVIAAYDATPKGLRDAGMHWYSDAHLLAKALAHGNAEEGAILLATYSPSANWPINMFRAARAADEGKPIPKGEGYVSGDQVKKAQKALDGQHIDQVLTSPKTRSFAHLIAQGDDSPDDPYGHVVIDAHALNVAAGGDVRGATYHHDKSKIPPEDNPPIGTDVRAHEYVGDMYRQAAAYVSKRDGVLISPHQMQAITWVGQVMANQAEDQAMMAQEGSAKGRLSARAKDWKRWLAYAKGHHFALIPGVSSLANQILFARTLEMVTGESISGQIELFNPLQPRDAHGRWSKGSIGAQMLDPFYNEVPEMRGTSRGKGIIAGGRDAEDAQKIAAYRKAHPGGHEVPAGADVSKTKRIRQWITADQARGNSRPVSFDEYQHLAGLGNAWVDRMKNSRSPATGLDSRWDKIKADSYAEVRKPWGGATIDAHTGVPLASDADRYALSIKPQGMHTVSVPETASEAEFGQAMDRAKAMFRPVLERQSYYLGVFHDDENHRIDIDPVAVVGTTDLVEQVGAYTRAIGGAYHFRTGDGYWPPHVAEGAQMAGDGDTVHFRGPGEWRSQADAVQDPEPDDKPDTDE